MSTAETSFACAWALVDELVRGGARHACISPGSRSTPLTLALARHTGVTVHVHLDERSGGFFALGLAKARREPVVVACTSGTATAELFPAVVEASQSRLPLVLLTADRPPRLRGGGANQTIDQVELYGRYVRWFVEAPVPAAQTDVEVWSAIGARAVAAARRGRGADGAGVSPPGPVHIDCPFEEPLVPSEAAAHPEPSEPEPYPPELSAFAGMHEPEIEQRLRDAARGLIIVGGLDRPQEAILDLADALGTPVFAEPTSGLRRPGRALAAGQPLASALSERADLAPDVVVQFGRTPTSRATQRLVAASGHRIVVVDERHLYPDPEGLADHRVEVPGEEWVPELIGTAPETGRTAWLDRSDAAARGAMDALLDSWEEPSEMRVARDLAAAVPDGGTLFVGNSMPVRDLDASMAPREGLRVLANRGASGIDGLLSTALGVAASGTGPVVALLGDLSFLYDAGALLWNARRGPDLVVVVNDNGGGQIFSELGQRDLPADELERLFLTPHTVDIEPLCRAAGAGHTRVERGDDLVPAVRSASATGGLQVVQVVIDAERDRARRVTLRAVLADILDRL
ncbi:MAG: 2-succinyl-5-enolpyruvyl-6-hydroxy-3-cyclohexene-1-carboxylic-acid synthase, partial [Actinobacteria bacterium]|nr:2-succinyl-5-enolpyruvyl-6-hydroxy-3-cyclohexene-1-carboxylic-acid synthase [Actinomycetota bacterium]